jgi:hypothetical protein
MATFTVQNGNTIGDAILNSLGLFSTSNWSSYLDANGFDSWAPSLYNGQSLNVPDNAEINAINQSSLNIYPANNFSISDIYSQIDEIFLLMAGAVSGVAPVIDLVVQDTNTYYTVSPHSTIGDAVLNSTGNLDNWSIILEGNLYDTWTPNLIAGERIKIPPSVVPNLNNFRVLNTYPANNFSVTDIYDQINAVFEQLNNPVDDWILSINRGYWSDNGYWRDAAVWID